MYYFLRHISPLVVVWLCPYAHAYDMTRHERLPLTLTSPRPPPQKLHHATQSLTSAQLAPMNDSELDKSNHAKDTNRLPSRPLIIKSTHPRAAYQHKLTIVDRKQTRHQLMRMPSIVETFSPSTWLAATITECLVNSRGDNSMLNSGLSPNLARNWYWSSDMKSLYIQLMEGVRWSDGEPFTADDILFTFNLFRFDPRQMQTWLDSGITDSYLEKVDQYQVAWRFAKPQSHQASQALKYGVFCPMPKHILSTWLAEQPDRLAAEQALKQLHWQEQVPYVGIGPWILDAVDHDQTLMLKRNPYYWKVDAEGRQLPYFDRVIYSISDDPVKMVIKGRADVTRFDQYKDYAQVITQLWQPKPTIQAQFFDIFDKGYALQFLMNEVSPSSTLSKSMLKERGFRQALAYGLGETTKTKQTRTSVWQPWPGGLTEASKYYQPQTSIFYTYQPQKLFKYLEALGFSKNDDGRWYLSDNSNHDYGQMLKWRLGYNASDDNAVQLANGVVTRLNDLGLEVLAVAASSEEDLQNQISSYDWVIKSSSQDEHWLGGDPSRGLLTIDHHQGHKQSTITDDDRKLLNIKIQMLQATDALKVKKLSHQYNRLETEQAYRLGLGVMQTGWISSSTLRPSFRLEDGWRGVDLITLSSWP
ncbi:MAG: ABC transporter substrate-binding protein [Pseudomonadota bacterium]|nr:ABC transporter substrate-binding protein [Pseudomonadota bacterium]